MGNIIKSICALHRVGVFAELAPKSDAINFLQANLIYGFNGSGKSTLSRLFASLQAGKLDERLPVGCEFEFELSDGTKCASPDNLRGLERRVLVFNADFIERNLQWATGTAKPVFYIGREQAEAAKDLALKEAELPVARLQYSAAEDHLRASERTLTTFKRERARLIGEQAHLRNRRYEAPHLERDFAELGLGDDAILTDAELDEAKGTCGLGEAMPKVPHVVISPLFSVETMIEARELAEQSPGLAVLKDLEHHPDMVLWVKQGANYHNARRLETCLFCDNPIGPERRQQLEQAFDDRLELFLARIRTAHSESVLAASTLSRLLSACPSPDALLAEFRARYNDARDRLSKAIVATEQDVNAYAAVLEKKRERPTQAVDISGLPDIASVASRLADLTAATESLNAVLSAHDKQVDDFRAYQDKARLAVRRHYLALVRDEYAGHLEAHTRARQDSAAKKAAIEAITEAIGQLRASIREHGPAAEKINKLIEAYLGHNELTIVAVSEGYEIHRHGSLLRGSPSEGEKTAISLCYFLSTLDADGRVLKDLILVIDDPISSLDSKGLNYACALLKTIVSNAGQVFLLTHNLPCMNEFKKSWKNAARSDDPQKPPTARLLFMDVKIPKGQKLRTTAIVEMSKLLREYDFEYHYLFQHVLRFQAAGDDYDYAYMMPNVLRRVLDVFLAFKCPGNSGLAGKIEQLCKAYPQLNRVALMALDRLVQTESHSDSLDDLIAFSSMTVEESRRATDALLEMMHTVDPVHKDRLMIISSPTK